MSQELEKLLKIFTEDTPKHALYEGLAHSTDIYRLIDIAYHCAKNNEQLDIDDLQNSIVNQLGFNDEDRTDYLENHHEIIGLFQELMLVLNYLNKKGCLK